MKKQALVISALALASLSGCASSTPDNSASIYNMAQNSGLNARIEAADYVLLGEKHDNPLHHAVQATILENGLREGDLVVFEMITSDQQPIIDRYLAGDIADDDLAAKLLWEKSGWPDWKFYAPLFRAAKTAKANILFGSYPRKELMNMEAPMDSFETMIPADQLAAMDEDMRASHCNLLPEHMIRPMSLLQIKKDRLLANQLLTKAPDTRAFLIAGNGHVGKERAAAYHLKKLGARNIFVLGLIEEGSEPNAWEIYSTYDAIWITEGLGKTHEDYCKDLRKKFGKS